MCLNAVPKVSNEMSSAAEEPGPVLGEVAAKRLCVLKFGSSVLEREEDYPKVVQEIYRHVRDGEKVVAVVSALAGETDELLAQASRVGGEAAPPALVTIKRCMALRLQARAMNSVASQSSNSGCVGGVPCRPKSFCVSTRPLPK